MRELDDGQLLETVLRPEHDERRTRRETEALSDIAERFADGWPLTDKQRAWIRDVAERLGIQVAPARNVFSSMSRREQEEHRAQVRTQLPWETGQVRRPLKPPGRS